MKVVDLVPEVYYRDSRDFSYIGRLLEVVFNHIKSGSDLVNSNPLNEDVSSSILDLLTTTLGFESKHNYINRDLIAICSSLSTLLREKGTEKVIYDCINILLNVQNISQSPYVFQDTFDSNKYIIYIPYVLEDIILIKDLFEYLLPAGIIYTFQYGRESGEYISQSQMEDEPKEYKMYSSQLSNVSRNIDEDNTIDEYGDNDRSMTYTGVVTAQPEVNKTYTVTWKNYDDTVLETDYNVSSNTIPEYNGSTPTKPSDDEYSYTFSYWSPKPRNLEGDMIYVARFKKTPIGE